MEDDFHIFNFGKAKFENEYSYAKIDHDYIVDKWEKMSKNDDKFKISELVEVLRTRNLVNVVDLIANNCRFSPSKSNGYTLRLAHTIRSKLSDRKVTTTSKNQEALFRSNLSTFNNLQEIDETLDLINARCQNDMRKIIYELTTGVESFKEKYKRSANTKKAHAIISHFTYRLCLLKNRLSDDGDKSYHEIRRDSQLMLNEQ